MKRLHEKVENVESIITKQKEESKKEMEKLLAHQHHEVQKKLVKVTKEVKYMQNKINNVLQNADTQISTYVNKQDPKWSEAVTKQVDNELKNWSTEVENMHKGLVEAKEQYDDIQDKEKRRNNIIPYRAQESTASTAVERNKEDVKFWLGLSHALNSGVDKKDILKAIRLKVQSCGQRPARSNKNLKSEQISRENQHEENKERKTETQYEV